MDTAIFGLRFKSNPAIQPSAEELRNFLERPKDGGKEKRKNDFVKYLQYLAQVKEFESRDELRASARDCKDKIVLSALSHSQFFKQTVHTVIEQYQYHYHKLLSADLKKPMAFIKSAEEEVRKLNPKKKEDQAKIARLQDMVSHRQKDIKAIETNRRELAEELMNITSYVKDNLVRIWELSESSITILVGLHIAGEKQGQLIEDIKTHFKDQIRDQLKMGPVTKQYVETLKADVADLSKQVSQYVLEDIYSATRVYEEIHDHAKKIAARLGELTDRIKRGDDRDLDGDKTLFGEIEAALVSLVSEFDFDIKKGEGPRVESERDKIISEKRNEMLDHLFALLKKGHADTSSLDRELFFH